MMEIVDVIKKNKTIWLPGILTTFVIWLPVAFGVSTLLLAGIRRGNGLDQRNKAGEKVRADFNWKKIVLDRMGM